MMVFGLQYIINVTNIQNSKRKAMQDKLVKGKLKSISTFKHCNW